MGALFITVLQKRGTHTSFKKQGVKASGATLTQPSLRPNRKLHFSTHHRGGFVLDRFPPAASQ